MTLARIIAAAALVMLSAPAVLMLSAPALAQVDPFEFEVYPYQIEGPGMVEIESLNSFVPKGHHGEGAGTSAGSAPSDSMYRTALEVSYGFTDKIEGAAYLNLAHPNGSGLEYAGSKYRLRGTLFEQGEMPADFGWYAELEWWRTPQYDDEQLELELRPIIEKDLGRFSLVLNPKFEKVLVGPGRNKGFEFGYATKLSWRLQRYFTPGIEFYGGTGFIDDSDPLHEQQHYIFPVVDIWLPNGLYINFGAGFGLTRGSDRVIT
ncbi:MAG TPA: hypothetical protein VLL57_01840, partial [Candidatus Binataceae bacterium]|nr:hypothetical protein [Candidatus Binataceae bacterium]